VAKAELMTQTDDTKSSLTFAGLKEIGSARKLTAEPSGSARRSARKRDSEREKKTEREREK